MIYPLNDYWILKRTTFYDIYIIEDHLALDRNPGQGYDTILLQLNP